MKRYVLERVYLKNGTLGIFDRNGLNIKTLELPDLSNYQNISCIPEGVYKVKKGVNTKGKNVFHVFNVPNRSGIQIHVANYTNQIKGCIAVGLKNGVKSNKCFTSDSAKAFNLMHSQLPDSFELEIKKKEAFTLLY